MKCKYGHEEVFHHDENGIWDKGCNQPLAMELGCPCPSFTPVSEDVTEEPDAVTVARFFHDTYEKLAPAMGYSTRTETREFDPKSPNGMLMIATAGAVLQTFCKSNESLESRLLEAEKVIDHYAASANWQLQTNASILAREWAYYAENGYDHARMYRAKYPKKSVERDNPINV